ncbi:TVP38/TMEM64 family protein [Blastococcus sp. SYSU DS0753]
MRTTAGASPWLRAWLLVALLAAGVVAALAVDVPTLAQVRSWADGGGLRTWLLLIAAQGVVLLAPVPRSVLAALTGAVLGFGAGFAVAYTGAFLAATGAFWLARGLGRPAVERLAGPRLGRVDRFSSDRGFVAVVLSRVVPMVPFVLVNYAAGLSAVRPLTYGIATAVGLVPGTVVQVGAGASAGAVVAWMPTATVAPVVIVLVLLLLAGAAVSRYRSRTGEQVGEDAGQRPPKNRPSAPPAPPTVRAAS